ncbi:HPr family phosphocarrier protein [Salmonella enterica]|uniref:HPr family phosphocarrier protein n=1 Tax=Salmonella enterica subsp. salamae TaxID=59202 RepID=A0A6C8YBJ9_SALER|nr:HPr family phosphocarrier protein [Salmonella enterica subsp. salamae]EDT2641751.1 HPr family phosphocarrier protein [Salmonella enterica subsp. enterica serovar Abony]EHI7818249.1 HPr family phosphocarrier protein [Salmonella enterica]ECC1741972.1 HPr family phosphocarrier protein [Salmonella enterica subsp. salamae]EDU9699998.1 HPr family phosphocarrier protein [Salmonella enterica subsp. salamae]
MPRFAANLSMMFTEAPFIERFAAAAAAGFQAVEFLFPYDFAASEIKAQLLRHDLTLALFNTSAGDTAAGEWGRAALPEREHDARADIDLALEYALALECEQVHIMAGVVPEGADGARYRATFIDNLRYAADRFAAHDKRILIEALSPGVKPGYLFSSQYQALGIAEEVDRPNVFIQLDTFHAQKVDGNLSHLIREYAGRYAHVQIASLPDRHEPDDGEINYPWLFRLFDDVGYRGWIGCEYQPRNTTQDGLGWFNVWR